MNELEFRPRNAMLFFWLLWDLLAGLILAFLIGGVVALGEGSALHGLWALIGAIVGGGYIVLYFFSITYALDDRYVAKESGVLWRVRRSIPLEKITNIDVRQGPVERLLGFGRIWIFTPSTGAPIPEERLLGVHRPYEMKQTIIDYVEASREGRSAPVTQGQPEPLVARGETVAILAEILSTLQRIEGKMDGGEDRSDG